MKVSVKALSILIIFGLLFGALSAPSQVSAGASAQSGQGTNAPQTGNPYFSSTPIGSVDGKVIVKTTISGPPHPPAGYEARPVARVLPGPNQLMTTNSLNVPAYDWVFGCSAVSSAMIAGYYDNNGYTNMYTGPANGGAAPMNSSGWGTWTDSHGDRYPNNPLVASHQGTDGRNTRGSIDDYWVQVDSTAQDPYITGGWAQHTWLESVGDYLKTSQSAYNNTDGGTAFYNYTSYNGPLTCSFMESQGIQTHDGTYGRKLFFEARGYTVTDCYNQLTDNAASGGFSFAQYKAEIDSGNPVLLNLQGHSIVGVGYDTNANTVYIHDTWDYANHTMTWGTSYAGLALYSVSIVHLAQTATPPGSFSKSSPTNTSTGQPTNPTLSWGVSSGATSYEYCYYKSGNNTCTGSWPSVGTATSVPLTGLDAGATYYWQVRARNSVGATDASGGWWSFSTANPAPTITSFTPDNGPIGTSVSITGTNFTGATAVGFNGVAAAFTVVSPTQITATVPQGAATGKITVTTPGGTAASSANFTVTYPVPTITSFTPDKGYPTTSVTITGTNFTGATAVGFNGVSASFTVASPTQINTTVPQGATTGKITVTTPGGTATSSADFTVVTPVYVQFSAPTATVNEGDGKVSIAVTLSAASTEIITVNYAASGGTASVGKDYAASTGTLTFPAGVTSQQIEVSIIDDTVDEADSETFMLTLSSPANAVITGTNPATITIVDNDDPPKIHFSAKQISVAENSGTVAVTVTLSVESEKAITIAYASSKGTADPVIDYTHTQGMLTFAPGETSKSITIPIINDSIRESDETFIITLSSPSNTTIGDPAAISVIIVDNDPLPLFVPFVRR